MSERLPPCDKRHPAHERVRYRSGRIACRACLRDYNNDWNRDNPEAIRDRLNRRRDTLVAAIRRDKDKGCTDCGQQYHFSAMEHDHRPGHDKLFNIANAPYLGVGMGVLRAEMAKCDVVCANCHRIRSYTRGQHNTTPKKETPAT